MEFFGSEVTFRSSAFAVRGDISVFREFFPEFFRYFLVLNESPCGSVAVDDASSCDGNILEVASVDQGTSLVRFACFFDVVVVLVARELKECSFSHVEVDIALKRDAARNPKSRRNDDGSTSVFGALGNGVIDGFGVDGNAVRNSSEITDVIRLVGKGRNRDGERGKGEVLQTLVDFLLNGLRVNVFSVEAKSGKRSHQKR